MNGCVAIFVFFSNMNVKEIRPQHPTFAWRFCFSFHRIAIPWARIHVLLVPRWMMRAVAFVSRLVMYIFRIVSEDCCLLPVPGTYTTERHDSAEVYKAPVEDDSGDQKCDCNSVTYKYEVQTSERRPCADLPFAKSRHGVCFMSGGCGLLVRSRTATSLHRLLTTPSRWTDWIAGCDSPYLTQWVPPFRRWRYLIYSGTRATSRKELPSHTGRSSMSQQVMFLPPGNAHVLTSDAKELANQTYDGSTMELVGRKFNVEQTSSALLTGFDQGILRRFQLM